MPTSQRRGASIPTSGGAVLCEWHMSFGTYRYKPSRYGTITS